MANIMYITEQNLLNIGFKKADANTMQRGEIQVFFEWGDYGITRIKPKKQSFWDLLFNRQKYEISFIEEISSMNEEQHFQWLKNNG